MTFTQTDPQNHQSENTWFTPRFIVDAMGGPFDLDPCTVSYRPFDTARAHKLEGVELAHPKLRIMR